MNRQKKYGKKLKTKISIIEKRRSEMNLVNVLSDVLNAWKKRYYECNSKKILLQI